MDATLKDEYIEQKLTGMVLTTKNIADAVHILERDMGTVKNAILGINGDDGVLKVLRAHDARIDNIEKKFMILVGIWIAISAIPVISKIFDMLK